MVVPTGTGNKKQASLVTQIGEKGGPSDNNLATDEQISKYCQNLEELLQKKIGQTKDLQEEVKEERVAN